MSNRLMVREATLDDREVVWQWWSAPVTRIMLQGVS